jgi:hypothetical protein
MGTGQVTPKHPPRQIIEENLPYEVAFEKSRKLEKDLNGE